MSEDLSRITVRVRDYDKLVCRAKHAEERIRELTEAYRDILSLLPGDRCRLLHHNPDELLGGGGDESLLSGV